MTLQIVAVCDELALYTMGIGEELASEGKLKGVTLASAYTS